MAIPFHDISYAQGQYNMAANTDPMVMMKASGFYTSSKLPYLDTQLVRNYALAKQYGKIPFMYHFAGGADPLTEAKYFIEAVSPLAEGDGYALDWEIDVPNPVQWVLIFVTHVHDVTGCWPWVYIDRSRRQAFDWSPVFNLCSEWIAAPDVSFDANIPGVGVYVAQQGPIINGVDTDEYFGTLDSLKSYTYKAPAPATVPAPTPTAANQGGASEPAQPSSTQTPTTQTQPSQQPTETPVPETRPAVQPSQATNETQTPANQTPQTPKVIIPDPAYHFTIWDLISAILRRIWSRL